MAVCPNSAMAGPAQTHYKNGETRQQGVVERLHTPDWGRKLAGLATYDEMGVNDSGDQDLSQRTAQRRGEQE